MSVNSSNPNSTNTHSISDGEMSDKTVRDYTVRNDVVRDDTPRDDLRTPDCAPLTEEKSPPILSADGLTMRFGNSTAITNVSISVAPGEVVCLLGDNGAGKSTLIKILSGVYQPTAGTLRIDGEPVEFKTAAQARKRGISTVHQYGGTIPLMSVHRNFFLGAEIYRRFGPFKRLDDRRMASESLDAIHRLGITRVKRATQLVGTLSGGERQALAIARALHFGARVLILDEPTAALGVKEAAVVLKLLDITRKAGVGVIFITHNAQHAMAIGDRFVVLIGGNVAATWSRGEKSRLEVLDLMAGGEQFVDLAAGFEAAHGI
jgi:simple sugar transport system ATP-binding protein